MCGIAGFIKYHGGPRAEIHAQVEKMAGALRHRGPDDGGSWNDSTMGVALGHRRLSIQDVTFDGHQPMVSPSGNYHLVFNGEIYNFRELRKELEALGVSFRGHSDSEVLLAAIDMWGLVSAVKRCTGMFAFALWDADQRSLSLVRDRMGEKPLYYGWQGKSFLFASELKALKVHPDWQGEINRDALTLYMRHNYIPAPYSIYQNIYKLLPGTILQIPAHVLSGDMPRPQAYWQAKAVAEQGVADTLHSSDSEVVEQLDQLLHDIIRDKMIADVPLGAFLSGGIDSSVIVALMQQESEKPIKTFSIGFYENGYNEAEYAKAIARHLGTEHTELYVTSKQAMDVIPRLPMLYDEPFSDSSQIPTFLVSEMTRQHVAVALSGDGGDELFAGYNRYFFGQSLWNKLRRVPGPMRSGAARLVQSIPPARLDALFQVMSPLLPDKLKQPQIGDKLHKLATMLSVRSPEAMYCDLVSHWKQPHEVVLDGKEMPTLLTDQSRWAELPDFVQRMQFLDMLSYLPDDILVKVDRAAMGVSLETRMPFLDHRLIEFVWRIPLSMKIRNGQGKWVLRQVLNKYVPKNLIERPKMGFGVPIDAWLRGPLRDWAEPLLNESRLRHEGFFEPEPIRRKWEEHLSGRRNWQYHIWDVLMFQTWLETQKG